MNAHATFRWTSARSFGPAAMTVVTLLLGGCTRGEQGADRVAVAERNVEGVPAPYIATLDVNPVVPGSSTVRVAMTHGGPSHHGRAVNARVGWGDDAEQRERTLQPIHWLHTYDRSGTFNVDVEVCDDESPPRCAEASRSVEVIGGEDEEPEASPRATPSPSAPAPAYVRPARIEIPLISRPSRSDYSGPLSENGNPLLFSKRGVEIEVDPDLRDPVTAATSCRLIVEYCIARTDYSVDQCAVSPPTCQTAEPWNEDPCCPADCVAKYDVHRQGGSSAIDAMRAAYGAHAECFPGLRAQLEGE